MTGTAESAAMAAVYAATNLGELADGYAGWAETYEAETAAAGYRLPILCAAFFARHVPAGDGPAGDGPVLDAGCGTGLVGDCLRVLGYPSLTGIDLSEPMLALAARRGIYAGLHRMVLGEHLDFPDGHFAAVIASGVFTEGHASHTSFDELIRVTRPGGKLVFSVRADIFETRGFRQRQAELESEGRWKLCEASETFRSFTVGEPDVLGRIFVYAAS